MKAIEVEIWSDIACPWCYVGKRRLEAALASFEGRAGVSLHWRPFELDPEAPAIRDPEPYAERLARKYQTTLSRAQGMIETMTRTAAEEGLELRFDRIRPGNTFDAHRLIELAGRHGLANEAKERFLRAYLTEGKPIGDTAVLADLAQEIGLERVEVHSLLEGDALADAVRAEEKRARSLGIQGVPYFLLNGRVGLSGAQPREALVQALRRVGTELGPR